MCSVTPAALVSDTLMAMAGGGEDNSLAAMRHQYNLDALEQSESSARSAAQNAMADAESARRRQQIEAAGKAGRARAGYGASGLSLDSGSILALMADQNRKAQAEAASISDKAARGAATQRQNEEYYAKRKNLYHSIAKGEQKSTLLGSSGLWRNALQTSSGLLELM